MQKNDEQPFTMPTKIMNQKEETAEALQTMSKNVEKMEVTLSTISCLLCCWYCFGPLYGKNQKFQ